MGLFSDTSSRYKNIASEAKKVLTEDSVKAWDGTGVFTIEGVDVELEWHFCDFWGTSRNEGGDVNLDGKLLSGSATLGNSKVAFWDRINYPGMFFMHASITHDGEDLEITRTEPNKLCKECRYYKSDEMEMLGAVLEAFFRALGKRERNSSNIRQKKWEDEVKSTIGFIEPDEWDMDAAPSVVRKKQCIGGYNDLGKMSAYYEMQIFYDRFNNAYSVGKLDLGDIKFINIHKDGLDVVTKEFPEPHHQLFYDFEKEHRYDNFSGIWYEIVKIMIDKANELIAEEKAK